MLDMWKKQHDFQALIDNPDSMFMKLLHIPNLFVHEIKPRNNAKA